MVLSFAARSSAGGQPPAARCGAQARYRGLIAYSDEAARLDRLQPRPALGHHRWQSDTHSIGPHMVNLLVWFDNEWGFASRMTTLDARILLIQ
jgi:D-erythrose 4-phosphate dehydrogenase